MKVFCDAHDCMFIDEYGFCDCDKLDIVGGVCHGSVHGGRNATENDAEDRLKAENRRLTRLVRRMRAYIRGCDEHSEEECETEIEVIERDLSEMGIEVPHEGQ